VAGLPRPAYGSLPPTLPLNPISVDVVWTPGPNDKVCKSVQVRANTRTASKLARDIDHAALDANAAGMFCLADDGTRVLLCCRLSRNDRGACHRPAVWLWLGLHGGLRSASHHNPASH
jgi:hypothetical protein